MLQALHVDDAITPQWLTAALRAAGALPAGVAIDVAVRANTAFNSAASHLTVTYSPDAPAATPRALFLKRNIPAAWAVESGRDEVTFYRAMAPHTTHLPMLIPIYAALVDETRDASTLLMLDVSATHAAPLTRDGQISGFSMPTDTRLGQMIDALAGFHAYWRQRPELGREFIVTPWSSDAAAFAAHVARRQAEWARFIAAEGSWFPDDLRAFYEREIARFPQLWQNDLGERMTSKRDLTLTHGDCYFTQFLCPNPGVSASTYLVDFQSVCADLPSWDLVHMFAFWWTREQRRGGDCEFRALRRYHTALLANGVRDCSWTDLLALYRIGLTMGLFYPIWDATNGSNRSYWLPKLRNIVAAYQDHCLAAQ
jgi:hypothetical protein